VRIQSTESLIIRVDKRNGDLATLDSPPKKIKNLVALDQSSR